MFTTMTTMTTKIALGPMVMHYPAVRSSPLACAALVSLARWIR